MISFVDITKTFYPGNVIFEHLSFDIQDGEFIFLTGVSGSGKTTLLNLLLQIEYPDEGDIIFQNQSLNALKRRQLPHHRQQIGVVFQDYKLINDLTVAENIALPLSIIGMKKPEIEKRVGELLTLINLPDRADHFPKQLSGGEAQRVGIARSLATAPKIIFADEPTGNLDYKASLGIAKLLDKINQLGTTVVVSTHDANLLDIVGHARHLHIEDKIINECPCCADILRQIKIEKKASPAPTAQITQENLESDLAKKVNGQQKETSKNDLSARKIAIEENLDADKNDQDHDQNKSLDKKEIQDKKTASSKKVIEKDFPHHKSRGLIFAEKSITPSNQSAEKADQKKEKK